MLSISASSQEKTSGVRLVAKATTRSIKLRWAPDSPAAWELGSKYGYTIERTLLTENGRTVVPVRKILNDIPFRPASQQRWESFIDQDDNVAIAAQALFGETFEIETGKSEMAQLISKAAELESRFSFALFCADQSVVAAELSGLYFEDETIAPGARYLYRVWANIPSDILPLDTGFVFLGLQDHRLLPRPLDLRAKFADRIVMLEWNCALHEKIYPSYWVERSVDRGRSFRRITQQPVINSFRGIKGSNQFMFRSDSLPSNEIVYHYRIRGIDVFGEQSPPSDTISGRGIPAFTEYASIKTHRVTDSSGVELLWDYPVAMEKFISSFSLIKASHPHEVFRPIDSGIDPTARRWVDTRPLAVNYYILETRDRHGRTMKSYPYLVQMIDSIPPTAPVGLSGEIDSLGVVRLRWTPNQETDLAGYAVYKANFASDNFIQTQGEMLTTNSFADTIQIKNLTKTIYYKVVAYDRHFNPSNSSDALVLHKPDRIAPLPPVFRRLVNDSTGVKLYWELSPSDDVLSYNLYRKTRGDAAWVKIAEFAGQSGVQSYTDTMVAHRGEYSYTLVAVDDAGNHSKPAPALKTVHISMNTVPPVKDIYSLVNKKERVVRLAWKYDQPDVQQFLIYRSIDGGPLKMLRVVPGHVFEVVDSFSLNDSSLQYYIVARFIAGDKTKLSRSIAIALD